VFLDTSVGRDYNAPHRPAGSAGAEPPMRRSPKARPRQLALLALAALAVAMPAGARDIVVNQGTNIAAATSPADGRLVFDLQGRLWSLPPDGGQARPLTDGLGDDRLPVVSPDGRDIAFQSFRNGRFELWRIGMDGRGARALTTGPGDDREPVYTPDGKGLLFTSDRNGSLDIFRLDLATGATTLVAGSPGDDYWPAVGPDGTTLAFVSDRSGRPGLWLQRAGEAARALTGVAAGRPVAPAFSPDGRRIAFVAPTEQLVFPAVARQRLFVVDLDANAITPVSAPDEDVFPFRATWTDADRLRYTADGTIRERVLTAGPDAAPRDWQWTARLPFQRRAPVRPRPLPDGGAVAGIVAPVVRPGTGSIVFQALGDLWERSPDGQLARLTNDVHLERDPAFSADGRWLAWVSDRSGSMQVWLRELATGSERRLTDLPRGPRHPTFAAAGDRLFLQQAGPRGNQDFTLHELRLDTGAVRTLKTPGLWPGPMGESGDRRHLLLTVLAPGSGRYREGRNELLRVGLADGTTSRSLLGEGPGPDAGINVTADGTQGVVTIGGVVHGLPLAADGSPAGPPAAWGPPLPGGLADYPAFTPRGDEVIFLGADGLRRIPAGPARAAGNRLPVALDWTDRRQAGRVVIRAGRLFAGDADGYRERVDVVVDDGRISRVAPWQDWPAGTTVIDATAGTVLPGLFDHHAHGQAHDGGWVGSAWLAFGITSVVEPGGLPYESREQQEAWATGRRDGPRLHIAGPQLDGDRRFFPFAVQAPDRARLAAELQRARRLDYRLIKTYTRLPAGQQRFVIRQAARLGIPVSSHEIYPALAMGGQRVEHLRGTSRLGYSPKQSDLLRSYDDVIGIVGRSGATIAPTIVVAGGFLDFVTGDPGVLSLPQLAALPAGERRNLAALPALLGNRRPLLEEALGNARRSVRELHAAGATIVAGTDAPIFAYGLSLHAELRNYAAAGLPPAVVLRTATGNAADALGLGGELGYLLPGRRADILVVAGDPLARIADLARVALVMKGGIVVARPPAGAP
jgi:Tol biopolymer transport system component